MSEESQFRDGGPLPTGPFRFDFPRQDPSGESPVRPCGSTETPLTVAAQLLDAAGLIIRILVRAGALQDLFSLEGATALHRAAQAQRKSAVTALLKLGSCPGWHDVRGLTPLYHAVAGGGDIACCRALMRAGAVVGCTDSYGWQETHLACRAGYPQLLEQLLQLGANPAALTASGNSPLHVAAAHGKESCAKLLLACGADVGIHNTSGQTPFQVALRARNFNLAEIMKDKQQSAHPHEISQRMTSSGPPAPSADSRCLPSDPVHPSSPVPSTSGITKQSGGHGGGCEILSARGAREQRDAEHRQTRSPWHAGSASPAHGEVSTRLPQLDRLQETCTVTPGSAFVAIRPVLFLGLKGPGIAPKDLVQVLSVGLDGLCEGLVSGRAGWIPVDCLSKVRRQNVAKLPGDHSTLIKPCYTVRITTYLVLIIPQQKSSSLFHNPPMSTISMGWPIYCSHLNTRLIMHVTVGHILFIIYIACVFLQYLLIPL
uniref:Uncharacterized protein n=1 Tax=Eptatretus burgeri TaxID=7764 RepID=A0A8C4QC43_EPTBU